MELTPGMYQAEMGEAMRGYDKHVVCLDKTLDQCEEAISSLIEKAIQAYENRAPNLRHGIALDKHITVILSQTNTERPLCAIYFNLSSPYHSRATTKKAKA